MIPPKPSENLIASNPILYNSGGAPSPTKPIIPASLQPAINSLSYSNSEISPPRFISKPVIGAAISGKSSLIPKKSIVVSVFLILCIVFVFIKILFISL